MHWYLDVLKKYVVFSGRASRSEFWWFTLISLIVSIVLQVIGGMMDQGTTISSIYSLAVLLPTLAVGTRRLHDIGRTGWWQLLFLTLIGVFVLIFFWAQGSEASENKYGPPPA